MTRCVGQTNGIVFDQISKSIKPIGLSGKVSTLHTSNVITHRSPTVSILPLRFDRTLNRKHGPISKYHRGGLPLCPSNSQTSWGTFSPLPTPV